MPHAESPSGRRKPGPKPRLNEQAKRSLVKALDDPEYKSLTVKQIGKLFGVSRFTVYLIKKELAAQDAHAPTDATEPSEAGGDES